MKPVKNQTVAVLALMVVAGVLIAALTVTIRHNRPVSDTPVTVYSPSAQRVAREAEEAAASRAQQAMQTNSEPETVQPVLPSTVAVGRYRSGEAFLEVLSCQDGYLEATLSDGRLTMEFAGQLVRDELTATETDSAGNTVEVRLRVQDEGLLTETTPILQSEENAECLSVSDLLRPE